MLTEVPRVNRGPSCLMAGGISICLMAVIYICVCVCKGAFPLDGAIITVDCCTIQGRKNTSLNVCMGGRGVRALVPELRSLIHTRTPLVFFFLIFV